jgi:hypothetical protein
MSDACRICKGNGFDNCKCSSEPRVDLHHTITTLTARNKKLEEALDDVGCLLRWLNTAEKFSMKRSITWLESVYLKIESLLAEDK